MCAIVIKEAGSKTIIFLSLSVLSITITLTRSFEYIFVGVDTTQCVHRDFQAQGRSGDFRPKP